MILFCVAAGYQLVQSSRTIDANTKGQPVTFYHCPRCELELPCSADQKIRLCPRCGMAKSVMEVSTHSQAPGGFLTGRHKKLVLALVIGLPALLTVTLLLAILFRGAVKPGKSEFADETSVYHCPRCSKWVKCEEVQVGRKSCPACHAPVMFPPHDHDQMRNWQESLVKWAKRSAGRHQDG